MTGAAAPRLLYLARHGETVWNLEQRLQGGRDSPLTARGRSQADAVATLLLRAGIGTIIASPLGRAQATAQVIGQCLALPVATDARLGELRFGRAEGLRRDEIEAAWPGLHHRREADKWHFRWPDGESYADAATRIRPFIAELRAASSTAAGALLVVAHETINTVLLGQLTGLAPAATIRYGQPNGMLYCLRDGMIEHCAIDAPVGWQPGLIAKPSRVAAG